MWKPFARTFLWLVLGLVGTGTIFFVGIYFIEHSLPPKLPIGGKVFVSSWNNGYVSAEGSWIIEGERTSALVQTTKISCFKQDKTCYAAQAEISFFNTLNADLTLYDIEKWDDAVLIFTDKAPFCVNYVYTISRANERAFGTRSPKKDVHEHCKEFLEQRDLKLTLTDGYRVWQQLEASATKGTMPFVWMAVTLWWVLIVYRIVRTWRTK